MKTKATRMEKSKAARARRKNLKQMIVDRTERLYTKLRKSRKK